MRSVFVFEKERIVCLDIKSIFSDKGFNVVFGQSVSELAGQKISPALVILDMESYRLFEEQSLWTFLGYENPSQVPLILSFTGKNDPASEMDPRLNIIGKVMKPYDTSQLVAIYKNWRKRQKLNKTLKEPKTFMVF